MSWKTALWLVVILVLTGVALRSYQLTARSIWFDEAFSWRLIQFPLPELITRDAADVHPPLFYILLKGWSVVFGSSLLSIRSFSVAMSAVAIALAYLFASYAFSSRSVGIVAALLFTVSGFQIQASWEARMYTLGAALVLLSAWMLLKAFRSRRAALGWWIAYALVAVAGAYTHYYVFFSILAQVVFIAGYLLVRTKGRLGELIQERATWLAASAGCLMLLIYAPWIQTFLQQKARVSQSYWIPAISGWSISDAFYHMLFPTVSGIPHEGLLAIVLALLPLVCLIVVIVCVILFQPLRGFLTGDGAWLTVIAAVAPIAIAAIISLAGHSVFQERYLLFSQTFLLISLAAFWRIIPGTWFRNLALVVFTGLLLQTDFVYWQGLDVSHKTGMHGAMQYIFQHEQQGEPVIVSSPYIFFSAAHYAHEEDADRVVPRLYSTTGELAHFSGGPVITKADFVGPDYLQQNTLKGLWVVDTTGFGEKPLAVPSNWRKVSTVTFAEVQPYQGDVSVSLYQR